MAVERVSKNRATVLFLIIVSLIVFNIVRVEGISREVYRNETLAVEKDNCKASNAGRKDANHNIKVNQKFLLKMQGLIDRIKLADPEAAAMFAVMARDLEQLAKDYRFYEYRNCE